MSAKSDLAFVLVARFDSLHRLENTLAVSEYMVENFTANVYVHEFDTHSNDIFNRLKKDNVKYNFHIDQDPVLHRTAHINQVVDSIHEKYVAIWDVDVIAPPEQVIKSIDLLDNGADFVYPYEHLSKSEILQLWGGGSVFLFDKMGNVVSVSENGYEYNEFKVGEKSFSSTNNIDYSTYSSTREIRDSNDNLLGIESYSGTCFTGMDWDVFDFVSRNTDVEWGLSCNGGGHGSDGYMVTQHKTDEFIRDSNSLRNGYDTLYHNHPHDSGPSSEDYDAYYSLMNRINQARYSYRRVGVYCPGSNSTIFLK